MTLIRRGSTQIGLIEQDAATAARPDALELVATGAGLIMETERLMAAARRDLEQSRQLASRLLSASDEPRAELRARLADGPLHDLAVAAADLADGASLTDIAQRLQRISAQVRHHLPRRVPALADHRRHQGRAARSGRAEPPVSRSGRDDRLPDSPGRPVRRDRRDQGR